MLNPRSTRSDRRQPGSSCRTALVAVALPCLGLALGCGGSSASVAAPTLTAFSPASGVTTTPITVTGSGYLAGVSSVTLGGVAVASGTGTILSDTQLSFPVPSAAVTGAISVVTPGGTAVSPTEFIVAPAISALNPLTGSASAGTPVTFTGSGLMGITQISFGTIVAKPTTQNANQIIVPVPAGAPLGSLNITLQVNPSYGLPNQLSPFTVTK